MNSSNDDHLKGLSEAASGFEHPTLETYEALHRLVLIAYGYRCAMVGEKFSSVPGTLHPFLDVVAIKPREQGGELKVSNYLCLRRDAADAFRTGGIIVASDYAIIADRAVVSRELTGALLDYLLIPEVSFLQPDQDALRYHRDWALRPD